ncbi:ketosteroid isomerase-like protein [Mucilaginibacter dorajii]|nr:nuclear transport factor 2 family protein [Mucilaginibacter dorajii]MCS3734884.1 ketosteroid isomerase-like protein [Mucilaginibacter dorajii]
MRKGLLVMICMGLLLMFITGQKAVATGLSLEDTVKKVKPEVLQTINTVLKASYTFDIDKVTDMYAPNAVVTDEQEPYSWNGQLAGVQWVNSVQKAVKDFKIKDFLVNVKKIKIFQQTEEVAYLVVPVEYTGTINGDPFNEEGAFSFVFRYVSGKWLIKSQAWIPKNGL